jgi:hypothetical protein
MANECPFDKQQIKRGSMTSEERTLVELAIGRVFRLMSRPAAPGDVQEYERCRKIVLDHTEPAKDYAPNWARDRLKGAQGD